MSTKQTRFRKQQRPHILQHDIVSLSSFLCSIPLKQGSTCDPLITPYTETGKIDVPGLQKLLQWHLDGGTDSLCVLGTTAEAAAMSMEEWAIVL